MLEPIEQTSQLPNFFIIVFNAGYGLISHQLGPTQNFILTL